MNSFLYEWLDSSNGMKYIGSTNGNRKYYIGSGVWFRRAYEKRPECFSRRILIRGEESVIREYEDIVLKFIDAENDPTYYNLKNNSVGGNGRGRVPSEEQRRKASVNSPRKRAVIVHGIRYESVTEAGRELGYKSHSLISRWANNTTKTQIYYEE